MPNAFGPHPGLYRPEFEHDACGVAFVAHLHGRPSHAMVEMGLASLCQLEHRGAKGADPATGDGAGLLVQVPDRFLRSLSGRRAAPARRLCHRDRLPALRRRGGRRRLRPLRRAGGRGRLVGTGVAGRARGGGAARVGRPGRDARLPPGSGGGPGGGERAGPGPAGLPGPQPGRARDPRPLLRFPVGPDRSCTRGC